MQREPIGIKLLTLILKKTTPKYYFSDNGLLNLFLDKAEARLLENPVAVNLWNRYKGFIQAAAAVKKAKKIFIITYDEEKELNVNGIKITVMPIWKWLIEN